MEPINEAPSVKVLNASQVVEIEDKVKNELMEIEAFLDEGEASSLASHIMESFQRNKDARRSSGIEDKLFQSFRAYNGNYDPEDLAKISEMGGSAIYMNLTSTKCRAGMSWIRDILLSAKERSFLFQPTPIPDIPKRAKELIESEIEKFAQGSEETGAEAEGSSFNAANRLKDINQFRRDFEEAVKDEIYKLAEVEVKKEEDRVADQLQEGAWDEALSDFIEDFCVFQVAVMKGPIITKKRRLTWENGRPIPKDDFIYLNKRVSPFDIYPSPSATKMTDGDLCEHLRLHRNEIYSLLGVDGYNDEAIRKLLEYSSTMGGGGLDTGIEDEKAEEEVRGDSIRANEDIFHGIHFFGSIPYDKLVEYGINPDELGDDELKCFEVEAILVGTHLIKCVLNDDPLLRRPYYKASFQNIPGSWWGRSLPELMRPDQQMCNATARSLSNNMGISSGPQVEVYIDRLAADEEIEEVYPWKLWQVTTDPTGASGRAVQFWQPSSNAGELLAVYEKFELKADDATGIPRYAHGNENVKGAAQTASGMSMLLESASKGIKDAVRHIDDGLIKPRVEYQFYWNLMEDEDTEFTGDIVVVPKGSQALTMKGSQEMRRNEFLQILANERFMQIVGVEGIAEILREMAKGLGLGENIIPSRIELKFKQKQAEEQAKQQAQAESQKQEVGIQQVAMQTQQAEQASQRSAQLKAQEIAVKADQAEKDRQLKAFQLEQDNQAKVAANTTKLAQTQMTAAQKDRDTNKNVALSIESGYQDKNNKQ